MNTLEEDYKEICLQRKKAKRNIEKAHDFLYETNIWIAWKDKCREVSELIDQANRLKDQLVEADAVIAKKSAEIADIIGGRK